MANSLNSMPTLKRYLGELIQRKQWVVWIYEERNGKKTKVLYNPITKQRAKVNVPNTWVTYAQAEKAADQFNGIGFVFTKDDPFTGIDIDKCIKKSKVDNFAQEIIDRFDSYCEKSVSGTGFHCLIKGKIPDKYRTGKGTGRRNGPLEIYDNGRYFTVSGNVFKQSSVNDCQSELDQLMAEKFSKAPNKSKNTTIKIPDDAPSALPVNSIRALAKDLRFSNIWEHNADQGSMSEYDLSLVLRTIKLKPEWNDEKLWSLIISHRTHYEDTDKAYRKDYIERTLKKAREISHSDSEKKKVKADKQLNDLNKKYFLVSDGGKVNVCIRRYDPVLKRTYLERIGIQDFKAMYQNKNIMMGDKPIPLGVAWLNWEHREQYLGGVIFDPSGKNHGDDVINLWQGLPVTPKKGKWLLMKKHICEVICSNSKELNEYVIGWLARLIQHPGEPGEVALVLQGKEGVGKGIFGHAIRNIFGVHGIHVSHTSHLVGNFNAHLQEVVFLFADEAFFAGDKRNIGVLKSLITEPVIIVEAKYINAKPQPNYLHILICSNEDWVIPVGLDARRFQVIEVSDKYQGNNDYFNALGKEIESGGLEAMVHYLLNHKLDAYNVRNIIKTEAFLEQQIRSLRGFYAWLYEFIYAGSISSYGEIKLENGWADWVPTGLLHNNYESWCRDNNEFKVDPESIFGKNMNKHFDSSKRRITGTRLTGYHLGTREQALELLDKIMNKDRSTRSG